MRLYLNFFFYFYLQSNMEEKKKQISNYLRTVVNPFVSPLMEDLVRKRPSDLLLFVHQYVGKLLEQRNKILHHADSEESDEQQQQANRKFQQKIKKNKGKKKISRQGISAQAYGTFNKKQQFVPKIIQKSQEIRQNIRVLLKGSVLFGSLSDEEINIVIDAMSTQQFTASQKVIQEGEEGQILYVVGSGEYDCSKVFFGKETFLKTYKTGESFGQLALMYTAPRAATIVCSKDGILYGLDRLTFKHIVEQSASKRRQKFRQILSKAEILSEIDPYEKQQLCDILKEETYNPGDYIVREGQQGNRFYLVAQGHLIAEKGQNEVLSYKQGDYFGEIALIRNTQRQASVKCVTSSKVVYLEKDSFKRLLGPIQQILKRNSEKYKKFIG